MDPVVLSAILLLIVSTLLGGGGTPSPLLELAVQLIGAGIAAFWGIQMLRRNAKISLPALVIAALFLLVPLVQLVPLPPSVWQALPGRAPEIEALKLVGAENSWRSISMAPDRTLASLLASIPPLLLLVMVASMRRRDRALMVAVVGAIGPLTLFVGLLQVRAGVLLFWDRSDVVLTGFQANRNTTADVLLVGLLAGVTALRLWNEGRSRPRSPVVILTASAVLSIMIATGVFMTGSRSGVVLLLIAVPAAAIIAFLQVQGSSRRPLLAGLGALIILAGAGLVVAQSANGSIVKVVSRFSTDDETRPELWRDTRYAINESFPFGTGIGTFVPIMFAAERLEVVDTRLPNRAHNEYLEYTMESGIAGPLAMLVISLYLIVIAWKEWRKHQPFSRAQISCAIAAMTIVALHSIVDYPFRSMSMASLIAIMVALLLPAPERKPE